MRTVIYKMGTFEIVKVVDDADAVDIALLPEDEDFMPVDLWNKADNKERFPTIE